MKVTATKLKGVYVVEPQVFGDARGWFMESWSKRKMEAAGIVVDFVQDNKPVLFSAEGHAARAALSARSDEPGEAPARDARHDF